jgi:hypothetical protein
MLILGRSEGQPISAVPAEVMLGAISVLRQMLEGPCCGTNAAIETFLLRGKYPLAKRCAEDERCIEITARGQQWLAAASPTVTSSPRGKPHQHSSP